MSAMLTWVKRAQKQKHETPPTNKMSELALILLEATANIFHAGISLSVWAHKDIYDAIAVEHGMIDRSEDERRTA